MRCSSHSNVAVHSDWYISQTVLVTLEAGCVAEPGHTVSKCNYVVQHREMMY